MRLLLFFLLAASFASAAERPPNIVIIFADDLGCNDLSCYGRRDQDTPNLDKLATQGARFLTAYTTQPICSPSRAGLLTGRSPARLHLTTFLPGRKDLPSQKLLHPQIVMQLPPEEQTLAELLKPRGYISACIGKWHLGDKDFGPEKQGFEVVYTQRPNTVPSATEGGKGEYALTAKAMEFVEANRDRPFFLYLAHNAPHIPLAAQEPLVQKYKASFNPVYAGVIATLDDSAGRLLAKLEELKLTGNTIVIFTSDNGGLHVPELREQTATHNTPYRAGKGFVYEGGLREPLIVRWPGHIRPGQEIATPVSLGDLVPTLLEAAGAAVPGNLDYVSILPLLTGQGTPAARPFFWHFPHYSNQGSRPCGAVREGQWKLVEHYEDGHAELYDLDKDPGETRDLSRQEPQRTAELRGKLAAWRQSVGAQENTPNIGFDERLWKPLYSDMEVSTLREPQVAGAIPALKAWRAAMDSVRTAAPDGSGQAPGLLILPAREATIHGTALRYEPQPQKNTLGFWKNAEDWASWNFTLPEAATYRVEILQGCGNGSGGAEVELAAGGQTLPFTVEDTGHFQNFIPRTVGTLKLPAGAQTLTVKPRRKPGAAVMDLRQITLVRVRD